MRIGDWSSDVCSLDLQPSLGRGLGEGQVVGGEAAAGVGQAEVIERGRSELREGGVAVQRLDQVEHQRRARGRQPRQDRKVEAEVQDLAVIRSEEHTSELQSLMRISYAVFCLKKKIKDKHNDRTNRIDNI